VSDPTLNLNHQLSASAYEHGLAQLAHDRFEIADTLHRFAFGLDHNDADSLASAITEDCRFDFRPRQEARHRFPALTGRDAILKGLLPLIGPLDTSHTASNLQIDISSDSATLHAYVMSQHSCLGKVHLPDLSTRS